MTISHQKLLHVKSLFEEKSGLRNLEHEFKKISDGEVIVIFVANPSERLFDLLNKIVSKVFDDESDALFATLKKASREKIIGSPEAQLLLKILAESQTVSRHSFGKAFFDRYTPTVSGAEQQIVANANHIVFGRRGAGKSMLLLYSMTLREEEKKPSAWLDFQTYSGRSDDGVISDVVADFISELEQEFGLNERLRQIENQFDECEKDFFEYKKIIPKLKREVSKLAGTNEIFVYLDDLHVLHRNTQSRVLDVFYSMTRGTKIFLKISAIENLTRPFDPTERVGLEVPHDAQAIHLDYNLTTPDKATKHIEAILDSHARFAGLPSIRRMCSSNDVLSRLTWVSAGVPRDAIYLFSQAIQKASIESKPRVTVSHVNQAASETLTIKLRDLEQDASSQAEGLKAALETIKAFCIKDKRKNAFLIEIDNNSELFNRVTSLVQLRLLHVISEGITPHEVGRKYLALILDYGLYIGIRAAQSVELFNKSFEDSSAAKLRKLPVLRTLTADT